MTTKEQATEILEILERHGHSAYLVGGCVRDLLLGREPADYDIATDATPTEVMEIFPDSYDVGAQFGVILVPVPKGRAKERPRESEDKIVSGVTAPSHDVVEVATFRSDIGYTDGRHPDQVRFSRSPREDVERRDFTINGLLLDPRSNEVLDYVDGRNDLRARVIRTIGKPAERIREDKLRMLRAVRFAARFQFTIETGTLQAIQRLASEIHQVSRERVRDELTKMLTEGRARSAFLRLDQTGLLQQVLPEIAAMKGVEQSPQFHPEGDVFVHTLLLLDKLPFPCPPTLAWGALLHDVGKPPTFRVAADRIRFDEHVEVGVRMAEEICRRLRFSNDDTEQILALVANHMRFADVERMKDSTFKKFARMAHFDEHLELHRLDCQASHGDLTLYQFTKDKISSLPPEAIRPAPLITGEDLIAAGHKPGPRFKEILAAVEDAQLEGRLETKAQAMELVDRQFPLADHPPENQTS
jgi:poly(A) polymerase